MRYTLLKSALLAAGLSGLTACGGGDDDDSGTAPVGEGDESVTAPAGGDGGPVVSTPGAGDVADPTPRYVTAACGDLSVSEIPYSNSAGAPAAIATEMLVAGRIDPDSNGNTAHYWSVDLQPGYYHLVLDTERVDDAESNIGIELTDLNGAGETDDERLVRGNELGERARLYRFLEIERARTLTLRATPLFAAEDYVLGLFANGTAVPSPRFVDCPAVVPASVGTSEALTLPADGLDDERWYEIDLEARDYLLDSTGVRTDGVDGNIIYQFDLADQFGQDDRHEQLTRVNEIGVSTTDGAPLRRSETGPVWLRLENENAALDVQFTVRPEG